MVYNYFIEEDEYASKRQQQNAYLAKTTKLGKKS